MIRKNLIIILLVLPYFLYAQKDTLSFNSFISLNGGPSIASIDKESSLSFVKTGYSLNVHLGRHLRNRRLVFGVNISYNSSPANMNSLIQEDLAIRYDDFADQFIKLINTQYTPSYYKVLSFAPGFEVGFNTKKIEFNAGIFLGIAFSSSPAVSYSATYEASSLNQYIGKTSYYTAEESMNTPGQTLTSFMFSIGTELKYNINSRIYWNIKVNLMHTTIDFPAFQEDVISQYTPMLFFNFSTGIGYRL